MKFRICFLGYCKVRLEYQTKPHARWQEWGGPFEEDWTFPGPWTMRIGKRQTTVTDGYNVTTLSSHRPTLIDRDTQDFHVTFS